MQNVEAKCVQKSMLAQLLVLNSCCQRIDLGGNSRYLIPTATTRIMQWREVPLSCNVESKVTFRSARGRNLDRLVDWHTRCGLAHALTSSAHYTPK
eukprot:1456787-Rhodomonas_salina.3